MRFGGADVAALQSAFGLSQRTLYPRRSARHGAIDRDVHQRLPYLSITRLPSALLATRAFALRSSCAASVSLAAASSSRSLRKLSQRAGSSVPASSAARTAQ